MKKIILQYLLSACSLCLVSLSAFCQLPETIDTTASWYLAWNDEFEYENNTLDQAWESQNGPSGHILCSRWREKAQVKEGVLHLINKKEKRGGQEWTSANIWTKERFQYGYFECRYKYAAAGATNNSFWLMTKGNRPEEGDPFEIDINEGHFPSEVNTNIHNWGDVHTSSSKSFAQGIQAAVNVPLEIPITTKKIRFASNNQGFEHWSQL